MGQPRSLLLRLPSRQPERVVNGYDAWKTTDREAEEAEQRWLDEEREQEFPPEYDYDDEFTEEMRS